MTVTEHAPQARLKTVLHNEWRSLAPLFVLVIVVVLAILAYPEFGTLRNMENLLRQNVPVAIVALAMTFVLIGGQFDLSVGAIYGASSVVFAGSLETQPFALAFAISLLFGLLAGALNALLVVNLCLPSFMATFASAMIILGFGLWYTDTQIPIRDATARWLGKPELFGLTADVIAVGVLAVILSLLLTHTQFGMTLFAVGGNREAARLAGLRVASTTSATFVIAGGASAVAGILGASRTGSAFPTTGADITLSAIAVVVIGGTSIWGGRGSIWRTIIGVLILAVLGNMFSGLSAPTSTADIVTGLAIVLAIALQKRPKGERA